MMSRSYRSWVVAVLAIVAGCTAETAPGIDGVKALFDLDGAWTTAERFYRFPYPSDLRLTASGAPELAGLPNPAKNPTMTRLLAVAGERRGFPMTPVAYFRFDGKIAARSAEQVIVPPPPKQGSEVPAYPPLLLVDTDSRSPERGRLFPILAETPAPDNYVEENLLALGTRPGIVLHPGRRYAFVVLRSLGDAEGQPLGVPAELQELKRGRAPERALGNLARDLYAPLWVTLEKLGISREAVAAATVFTTGDVVAELAQLSSALIARHRVEIELDGLDPDDGDHPRYCELLGKVRLPQFQRGTPPYNTEGLFEATATSLPKVQREELAPIVITLPKGPMPAGGYPIVIYYHGSGGTASEMVDRGRVTVKGAPPTKGEGPAHLLAPLGLAGVSTAMPLSPDRFPGAQPQEYLNAANLAAFRDTFRQGVVEARLVIDALRRLEIAPAQLGGCSGPTLPPGATSFRLDLDRLHAMGQSMGGLYTNLVGAVDPRVRAVVPTGAGGHWSYFVVVSSKVPGGLAGAVLGTVQKLSFLHPALHLLQEVWEPVDPIASTPRLARWPLPGHPARPIYQPAGKDDSYFPTTIYDAMALAYGNEQAGTEVWPTMQQALALDDRAGLRPYPVRQNRKSSDGRPYTGVVVQYLGDGIYDPHGIVFQLDAVVHQYTCFFSSFLARGEATVPAPAPVGTPCL